MSENPQATIGVRGLANVNQSGGQTLIWGRMNAMEINAIQATAAMATGNENSPR